MQNGQMQLPFGLNHEILIIIDAFVVETLSHFQCSFILIFAFILIMTLPLLFLTDVAGSSLYPA